MKTSKVTLLAAISIAMAFTISCSSDNNSDGGGTNPSSSSGDGGSDNTQGNSGTFTDTRDSKTYKWVKIDEQIWMAENLNYDIGNSPCNRNDPANCTKYGRLYDWATAMTACPSGWRMPNDAEWNALIVIAGGFQVAGAKLKAKSGWNNGGDGTDNYGFSALPGGDANAANASSYIGERGYWWSSLEYAGINAYFWRIEYNYISVDRSYTYKEKKHSVRCVQD